MAGRQYTIMIVDFDCSATVSTQERPLLHWLHTNLKATKGMLDLDEGRELLPYVGPTPPNNDPHMYYVLVVEQMSGAIDLHEYTDYLGNCSSATIAMQDRWVDIDKTP